MKRGDATNAEFDAFARTYEEALEQLSGGAQQLIQQASSPAPATPVTQGTAPSPSADPRILRVREHLRRYRDFAAQGKWADAGKELEAVEAEVK